MRKGLFVLGGAALMAVFVVACGGDDDSGGAATATATRAASTGQQSTNTANATNAPATAKVTAAPATTSADNGGQDGVVDACTLLTKDEVVALLGPVADGDVTDDQETSACFWAEPDNPDNTVLEIVVDYETNIDQARNLLFDSTDAEAIDGLGDEAHWYSTIGMLEVLSGFDVLNVEVTQTAAMTDADLKEASTTLAQKIVDRLP